MGGFLTTSSTLMCPHGGTVMVASSDVRVQAADGPILRSSDVFTVVGCPFTIGVVYHPCATLKWVQPSLQSQAMSDSTLTQESVALTQAADQAVQGTAQVVVTQPRDGGS
jgi:hypothetical protein